MVFLWTHAIPTPRVSLNPEYLPMNQDDIDAELGDWECFTAAIASADTRDMFIKTLATWVNETPTNRPLTDLYDTESGKYVISKYCLLNFH
jgi:hypothetical protein